MVRFSSTDQRLRTISCQRMSAFGDNRFPPTHGRGQHRGRDQDIRITEGSPAVSVAVSSKDVVAGIGCRHWWRSCSPNPFRLCLTLDNPTFKRARLRDNFVPSCVEEILQWVWDRPQDFQEATVAARPVEVGRISQLVIRSSSRTHHGGVWSRNVAFHDAMIAR